MDKEEFKRKLTEVANWRMPKIMASDGGPKRRGRPATEEQYQKIHEGAFIELFDGVNPTSPLELVSVNRQPVDCPDCGKFCAQGRELEIKIYAETRQHIAHRRIKCVECRMYRNPDSGCFDVPFIPATQVYLNWAKRQFTARNKQAKIDSDK